MIIFACTKCEYIKQKIEQEKVKLNGRIIKHNPKQCVAVIGKEEQKLTTLPTVKIECERCGNNTANVWLVQTRGLDESSTQFLRCLRCGYTFREYT